MKEQLHKRLNQEFVEKILDAFNRHKMSEKEACGLLGIKRARLYKLRKVWRKKRAKGEFKLYNREDSVTRKIDKKAEEFLDKEFRYITCEASKDFRNKFNFAVLSEEVEKHCGIKVHRSTIRRLALRNGYYHALPEEKEKAYIRFEMAGIGMLFQHDTSIHCWIPCLGGLQGLIMTEDDYSRLVVGGLITKRETSWDHLVETKEVVLNVGGIAQAYYLDNHSIFRFPQHDGIHVTYIKQEDEGEVQFKRVIEKLGSHPIYIQEGEKEGRGKIEKRFDYFQRRVPYLCERYKVKEISEANKILREEISYYNEKRVHEETEEIPIKRWNKAKASGKSYIIPIPEGIDWDYVFSLHYDRTVDKYGAISFEGKKYTVDRFIGKKVTLCLIPKKKFMIYSKKNEEKLCEYWLG